MLPCAIQARIRYTNMFVKETNAAQPTTSEQRKKSAGTQRFKLSTILEKIQVAERKTLSEIIYHDVIMRSGHRYKCGSRTKNFTDGYIGQLIAYNYGNRGHLVLGLPRELTRI